MTNSDTIDNELRRQARERARNFIENETQFHLGMLPTEQSHPYTRSFSTTVRDEPAEGVRLLLSVDQDLPPVARRIVLSRSYDRLVDAFLECIESGTRVCFSGCGSTGRLSILLEEMWRGYWEDRDGAAGERSRAIADRACSIMTGGDRALISSVEGFEDFQQFGRRQVADLGLGTGDLFIAISEGGETSSVIGTAWEAVDRGCRVFFIYNNPTRILIDAIERSRDIIQDDRVTAIDLFSGSMALSGSTRMQATTLELYVVGSAMEEALDRSSRENPVPGATSVDDAASKRLESVNRFASLIASLQMPENRRILGEVAETEARLYEQNGLVTYFARRYLLDIFCDTTERTPTFMLPPFRPAGADKAPDSWAFAKDPRDDTEATWNRILRRTPRGIDWTAGDYREMQAPQSIIDRPPKLDLDEILRYRIGNEDDPRRYGNGRFLYIRFYVREDDAEPEALPPVPGITPEHYRVLCLTDVSKPVSPAPADDWTLRVEMSESGVRLWQHLAVKLIFNTMSTASMGIMERIRNNWMVQVDCTNKKLIDRGSRIVSSITGISYEDACYELHLSLLINERLRAQKGHTTTSAVVNAIERISGH